MLVSISYDGMQFKKTGRYTINIWETSLRVGGVTSHQRNICTIRGMLTDTRRTAEVVYRALQGALLLGRCLASLYMEHTSQIVFLHFGTTLQEMGSHLPSGRTRPRMRRARLLHDECVRLLRTLKTERTLVTTGILYSRAETEYLLKHVTTDDVCVCLDGSVLPLWITPNLQELAGMVMQM
jgi:hypothetical protein